MTGVDWLIWVAVAVVLFRLVRRRRRYRDWWWDGGLGSASEDGRLGEPGWDRDGWRGHRRRLERRRAALEEAADRLEEAGRRLRGKANAGFGSTMGDGRSTIRSSASSGSGRRAVRKRAETPLATLQRRFAEGHITMEQYERELDKLYGLN